MIWSFREKNFFLKISNRACHAQVFATTEIRKNNNPKNRVIIVGKLLTYTTVILLFAI